MRNVARERERAKCEPPMTPMIDIIFQLLLFFMLMPIEEPETYLTTNLPKFPGPNDSKGPEIVLRIKVGLFAEEPQGKGVTVELNQTQQIGSTIGTTFVTEADKHRYVRALFDKLENALSDMRGKGLALTTPVLISPTPDCRHEYVVAAFDAAVAARFTNIQFAVPTYMARAE